MTKELIINDTTALVKIDPTGLHTRGLQLELRGTEDYAYGDLATPFPQELLIPRSEWQGRIAEMQEQKSRLSDVCKLAGLPCKQQGNTNYCWINAPTYATEVVRVQQNQPLVILSPASAGAQLKNYRNVGGWGKEGLEWIIEKGLVPVDKWPANAIDKKYATQDNLVLAKQYRVVEWIECQPRNLDQLISLLLRRIPVPVGYNWWLHEVTAIDPVWIDGEVAIRIRNSWGMEWGDQGYGILQGNRMLPDDAVAPFSALVG